MIWLMALTTGWATTTGAPVPVQGVLTGADGSPLNGTHNLTFRLHAAADGSSALHTDTSAVQLSSGGFAATISGVPLEVLRDHADLWVGVKVDGGLEAIAPLGWAPRAVYATLAGDAAALGGLPAADYALQSGLDAATSQAAADLAAAEGRLSGQVQDLDSRLSADLAQTSQDLNNLAQDLNSATTAWSGDLQTLQDTLGNSLTGLAADLMAAQSSWTTALSDYYTKSEVDDALSNVAVDAYTRAEVDTLLATGSTTALSLAQRVQVRSQRRQSYAYFNQYTTARSSAVPFYATGGPVEFLSTIPMNSGSHTGCRFAIDGIPAEAFSIGDTAYAWESGLERTNDGWQTWDASRVYLGVPPGYHVATTQCFNDSSAATTNLGDGSMTASYAVIPYDPVATGEVKAYTATTSAVQNIALGAGPVTLTGLNVVVQGQGGPYRVSYQIPMSGGSTSTCRTLVDGVVAGVADGDNGSEFWQEGLTYTADGWAMWSRNRVFGNLSTGPHTISVQCRTDSGTVTVSDSAMTAMINVFTYPSAANAQKVKVSYDNHIGYMNAVPNGTWTTQTGLATTFTSNGGPVQIGMSIPLSGGSTSACRPIVDGAALTAGEPDDFGTIWQNGLVYTVDGWAMWDRTRIYKNIPAGTHTLGVQCVGDSGSYSAGYLTTTSQVWAIAYDN
jgi:hypothetical protein